MARTRTYTRRSPQQIDEFVERFGGSGLTQMAFAERHGLSVSTLRSWLRRRSRRHGRGSRFVPVTIVDPRRAQAAARLEIELGSDRRLLVPADFDRDALAALLPVIVASC